VSQECGWFHLAEDKENQRFVNALVNLYVVLKKRKCSVLAEQLVACEWLCPIEAEFSSLAGASGLL
jgi:hypothetical protein